MSRTLGRVNRADTVLLLAGAIVLASVMVAMLASPVADLDGRARSIEAQLRCPTCQGLSIADSPATAATQMRALVREQLAGGASDDEVRAFFVARYGRWVLLDPPFAGTDLVLWLAPVVIVGAGVALVVRRTRRRTTWQTRWRWAAPPGGSTSRLTTALIGGAMVVALAVPIVAAVGPRLNAGQISDDSEPQGTPSIEDIEAFVRAHPGDLEALVILGDALLEADRLAEAAERYKAVLEIDPNNVPALLGVGVILLASDRPDGAASAFDRVLDLQPDHPDALLYRAYARLRVAGHLTADVRSDVEHFLRVASPGDPRIPMAQALLDGAAGRTARPGGRW